MVRLHQAEEEVSSFHGAASTSEKVEMLEWIYESKSK